MGWKFLARGRAEGELEEELRAHIELQARKHISQGMRPEEAWRLARIEFGGVERAREEWRDVDRWSWIDRSMRNLRHCFRSLARSPGFAFTCILILTVGIGSNLAVFSTIDALLLRPLPIQHPEELVRVALLDKDGHAGSLPSPILDVLKQNRAFQAWCGVDTSYRAVEIEGNMRSIGVAGFSGTCFDMLRVRVQLGRAITPDDDRLGAGKVAVITDSLWRDVYAGRPDVLGKAINVGGDLYTIVGVTEGRFTGLLLGFPEPVMIPLHEQPSMLADGRKQIWFWVNVLGRRAPGVTEAKAMASILAEKNLLLESSVPLHDNAAERKRYLSSALAVIPGRSGIDYFLRERFGNSLYAIFGICAALLLIACVNLTSLLLARSFSRRHEIAVRLALGARRNHIAGMLVLESAILTIAGTIAGWIAGFWMAQSTLARGDQIFGNFSLQVGLDARVTLFLSGAVLLVLGIFAAASLWQADRLSRSDVWKESGRGAVTPASLAQKVLIGVQIALTLAFVAASTLFGASVKNMYSIDFGIDPSNVWELLLDVRPGGYRKFDSAAYYRDLVQQIESLPDVRSVSMSDEIPYFSAAYKEPVAPVENTRIGGEAQARVIGASDGYFSTLGAKLLAGEDFRRGDNGSTEPAVILSQSLAEYLISKASVGERTANPRELLNHHVRIGNEGAYQRLKVLGIASDMDLNLADLDDKKPLTAYIDLWQHADLQRYPVLLIKTSNGALPLTAIRRILDRKGREYVHRATTIDTEIDNGLVENRLVAYLAGTFGAIALAMAAAGLFGLLSYQVANRRNEIGVRMALGAKRSQIRWLVLGQTIRLLLLGGTAGIALTFALQKAIAGLLYGVTAYDARVLVFSCAVLASTAILAAWIPAQRASAVDPLDALRHE